MIGRIRLEVSSNEEFVGREEKLIDLFILNAGVFVNAINTGKPMMLNPIESSKANFSLELVFQNSIEDELGHKMAEDLKKRIDMMFEMAEIHVTEINSVAVSV